MSSILAETLSGKSVMGNDGTEIGLLYNVTMDADSGRLHDLVVEPKEETPERAISFDSDAEGRYRVPVGRVKDVEDYVVVER